LKTNCQRSQFQDSTAGGAIWSLFEYSVKHYSPTCMDCWNPRGPARNLSYLLLHFWLNSKHFVAKIFII